MTAAPTQPDLTQPAERVLAATRRWMALLALPVLLLLAVLTALQYRQGVAQAERDLAHQANQRAQDVAQLVQPAIDHVHDLRALLQLQWAAPPDSGPLLQQTLRPRWLQTAAGTGAASPTIADGWTLDDAPAALRQRFGQVWWAAPDGSPAPAEWLRRAASFTQHARVAHARAPGFEATWFAGTDTNTSFGYPWLPTSSITQAMGTAGLVAIAPVRDAATASTRQWMASHPGELTYWSPPAISQLHQQLVVSHGALVMVDGAYRGEVSVDFRLDDLQRRVAGWAAEPAVRGARLWIVSSQGQVVADSAQALQPAAGHFEVGVALQTALHDRLPAGLAQPAITLALQQPGTLQHPAGWVLVASRQAGAPWTVLLALPEARISAQVWRQLLPNGLVALALLLMFGVAQWLLAHHFIEPAVRALSYGRALALDPQASAPQLGPRWRVWVDATTEIFRSQRALLQHELDQRRQRDAVNSAIVDHALAAIVSADAEGRIVEFNPAAEAMFGRSRASVLGQVAGALLVPARLRGPHDIGFANLVSGTAAGRVGRRVELQALHADGREFPVELVGWRTEIDGAPHFTAWMVDLTERLQARDQLERQREALRQSEKLGAMGQLLAGVAHELNNPLAIVMGRAALLEEKLDQPAAQADARRIRDAAERCGRIVRTFLNMARARPAQRGPVALNDLVRGAADMLAYTWRSHGIQLHLQLADGLPPAWADSDQIGQVVLNLLVNAQHALADGPGPHQVWVSSGHDAADAAAVPAQANGSVWLRVMDNGPGVPAAAQARLFEPYFTTKAEGLGTGLGLALARTRVREHGGELLLDTAPAGGGASFCLRLPAATAEARPAPQRPAANSTGRPTSSPPGAAPPALQPACNPAQAHILVVDDEPGIAALLRDMLEGAGHAVLLAASGAAALQLLDQTPVDAIVSDLRMPDIDGAGLWRSVDQHHPGLAARMLFVTGDTLSPAARQFLAESGCHSLDKPFHRADLLAAVARLLALR